MNEELKKALQLALKAKGLNEGLAGRFITVEKEDEIEGAINDYIALAPPTGATQMLENPEVKREIDRRITAAVKTNTENLAKKHNFDPAKEPAPKNEPGDDTQPPTWAKQMLEDNKALKDEIAALKTGKETETKQQQALSVLSGSQVIPENVRKRYENRFNLNSETPFEDQLKELEAEYTEIAQTNNNGRSYAGPPATGGNKDKPSKEQVDKIVGKI